MRIRSWHKRNKRGTHYHSDCGDELRITHGTHYKKPVYNIMLRKQGSYWMKHSHCNCKRDAQKNAVRFMKKKKCM